MTPELSEMILELLKAIGPLLAPVLVGIVKSLMGEIKDKIPALAKPFVWPILSAIFGAIIAFLEGWSGGVLVGGAMGLAGAKVRDFAVGKPHSSSTPDPL